jgi:hypothetical protein
VTTPGYPYVGGVHLLPSTGEFSYDTIPAVGFQRGSSGYNNATVMNTIAGEGPTTDYTIAINQLQAQHPECATVSLVIAWFFNSEDGSACNIYPSTNFILGEFLQWQGGTFGPPPTGIWNQVHWQCSSLTEQSFNINSPAQSLIPLPAYPPGSLNFAYGGTPSDDAIVRCIRDLKSRGFKVVFYPFLLGTSSGFPWRGRITFSPDVSQAATSAVSTFMGSAAVGDFTQVPLTQTGGVYSGGTVAYTNPSLGALSPFDWTYRRMILHYANLCCVAGGVNLFVIGSELRGLETIRGPAWTPAGTTDGSGNAVWDMPFVAALVQLAADVRTTFNNSGFAKNTTTLQNLIVYSADWSSFMGWQYTDQAAGYTGGQWPHLDQLWSNPNIDFASLDNYMPLTDWTTGTTPLGGLDAQMWEAPAYTGAWPPPSNQLTGWGLNGPPSIYDTRYLMANIEGGQYFNWFYDSGSSGAAGSFGLDPLGSGLMVTVPTGDREVQQREPYCPGQQILANKQIRWWWNNLHYAVYDDGDGHGWAAHGPHTEWAVNSKPLLFLEYGIPAVDKGTNQPNVFFDAKSTESATPYWSIWQPGNDGGCFPLRDDTIQSVALNAIYTYWVVNGNIPMVGNVPMIQWAFCCAWNWDARPFPIFPINSSAWGDTLNWQQGDWINGVRSVLPPPPPASPPVLPDYHTFPPLATVGWAVHIKPRFPTRLAQHVSGREIRSQGFAYPYFDIELTYEVLRSAAQYMELQEIAGFFEAMSGKDQPFWVAPPGLSSATGQAIGTGNGTTTAFPLVAAIGGYTGPVYGTSGVTAVYLNGVSQPSNLWNVSSGYAPVLTFTTSPPGPPSPATIAATFGILWLCRFAEDVQDFEEFMTMLFQLGTLRLTTVRP